MVLWWPSRPLGLFFLLTDDVFDWTDLLQYVIWNKQIYCKWIYKMCLKFLFPYLFVLRFAVIGDRLLKSMYKDISFNETVKGKEVEIP